VRAAPAGAPAAAVPDAAPAAAQRAAMAVEAEAAEEAPPAGHALKDMRKEAEVLYPGALGVLDGALGGLLRRQNAGGARLVQGADPGTSLAATISQGYHIVVENGAVFVPKDALPVGAAAILDALAPAAAAAQPPGIANEVLADVLGAAPLLSGAAAGPPGLAVRQATALEILEAARVLPPRQLDGREAVLPLTVFHNGYTPNVLAAVKENSCPVPPPLTTVLGGFDGVETKQSSGDLDSFFVEGEKVSSLLLKRYAAARICVQPAVRSGPAPLTSTADAFRKLLAAGVGSAAALRARATEAGADADGELFEPAFNPAAALRRENAHPSDLAHANAADSLDCPAPTPAALAAVQFVTEAAARMGYNGAATSVSVPCSGYAALCTVKLTSNPKFAGRYPALSLPSPADMSGEPLVVCVVGWDSSVVAQAVREVATAFSYLGARGSTGSATWALWYAGAATGEARQLPGGACVPLAVLVHLLCNFPTSRGPLFWIKTYNQKARGAVVTLPDKLEDFGEAEAAAAGKTLVQALQGNNSVVPLLYDLFAGDPTAALVSFGAGVAVDSVLREGKLKYANVRLNVVEGRLFAGVDGGEPLFSGGGFEPLMRYPPFGCPPDLAPCTARRSTASVLAEAAALRAAKPGSNVIVSVGVQCYSRAANYAPGPAVCMKAGDLLGATTVGIDGTTLGRRVLFEATKAAAAYSSTYLTQLAATGPLARCDAVWAAGHVGAGVPLAAALGASLGQSVALFRRGLVTANLDHTVTYMASGCTSLFAAYTAALRALGDPSMTPIDSVATHAFTACLAGMLRLLPTGRMAGHGALPVRACNGLNINQLNALPPLPPCVAAVLGLAPPADVAFEQLHVGGLSGVADAAAAQASSIAACLAADSTPFVCAHRNAEGVACGATFSSGNKLFEHLKKEGHHAPPTGADGAYVTAKLSNKSRALRAIEKLSHTQKIVVCSALATGRSVVLGGPGGTGKTVITRALVEVFDLLFPDGGVLWMTPTGIARLVAGEAAFTLNAAIGIGKPGNSDTVADLVAHAKRKADSLLPLLRKVKLLIVDEAHRMGEREMRTLQALLQWANGNNLPFGGVQGVYSGDAGQSLNFTDKKLDDVAKVGLSKESTWLMSDLGKDLHPLYFELTEIRRTNSPEFIDAQLKLRLGQRWAKGESAYDYLHSTCAETLPANASKVRKVDDRWVPSLAAVRAGYTCVVGKHDDATFAEKQLFEEAKEEAGEDFKSLTIAAYDALRTQLGGVVNKKRADPESKGGGAPPLLTLYLNAVVACTNPTKVKAHDGTEWTIPTSVKGMVTAIEGSNVDNVAVTVEFPATPYSKATKHVFRALWVNSSNVTSTSGSVPARFMVQLRPGGCITMAMAQGITLDKGVLVLEGVHGSWATALLYTALGRFSDPSNLIICFDPQAVNRANTKELDYFKERAEETARELYKRSGQPLRVVRCVTAFLASHGVMSGAGALAPIEKPADDAVAAMLAELRFWKSP